MKTTYVSCGTVCEYCKKRIWFWQSSIRPTDWYHYKCAMKKYKIGKVEMMHND